MHQGCSATGYCSWYVCSYVYVLTVYVQLCLGLNVVEVAHDIQKQVSKYVTSRLKLINSYDTWHGNTLLFPVMFILNAIIIIQGQRM